MSEREIPALDISYYKKKALILYLYWTLLKVLPCSFDVHHTLYNASECQAEAHSYFYMSNQS